MARRRRGPFRRQRKKTGLSLILVILLGLAVALYSLAAVSDEFDLSGLSWLREAKAALFGDETSYAPNAPGNCEVHFLDVGQGDSELILSDGQAILIDGGENDQGRVVADALKSLGVKRIDLLIATHPHSDHIGGLDTIVREFDIGKIVMPRLPEKMVPTTRTYTDLLNAIADKGLRITPARPDATFAFGAGQLTILGPRADYDDLNDTSLVCRFTYAGESFLFTGDMEAPAERDLLASGVDLKADVLKVGHHGSSTSTTPEFYKAVDPSVCVISCGEGNSYGHPNEQTLETIATNGAAVYRTDFQGSITIAFADGGWNITTQKGGAEGKVAA